MFPILYEQITAGTVPQHNGLGVLSDCISCEVEQARNDIYELVMVYPLNGIHADELAKRRLLKVKPNFTDAPQLFRIDRIGGTMKNNITVYAKHISYDLSGYEITEGTANNASGACLLLENSASGWSITTDKEVTADFSIDTPASVKSYFAGREGSFLDVYGTAEIKYDNFNVQFLLHAGMNRGVTIYYGKNLLELSKESDASNLYTHVLCYFKNEETKVVGTKVATGLVLDVPKTLIIDASEQFEAPPTISDLTSLASHYISENNLTVPLTNITLDYVQSGELTDRVDLCDTVTVHYEALGVNGTAKCIRTKWDCLREKYIETEFGDVKKDIADIIAGENDLIKSTKTTVDNVSYVANSKKRVFISQPVPPYDEGDLWTDNNVMYYCSTPKALGESFDSEDWTIATSYIDKSTLETAIAEATEIITGGTGGNITIRLSEGKPYEVLAMNTDNVATATRVLRLNYNGIGISTTGVNGPFITAITAEGMNASAMVLGTLDASRVMIQNLTATMIHGGKLTLGGYNNQSGTFELKNEQGVVIGEMDKRGLVFYGEGAEGARPYVLLNNTVGFAGYDANGVEIFKVSRDAFVMKKCVATEEISACGKVRMIPITLMSGNSITNQGVALVGVVDTGE